MTEMTIYVNPGLAAFGPRRRATVIVEDDSNVLYANMFGQGANCFFYPEQAELKCPYLGEILKRLVRRFSVEDVNVSPDRYMDMGQAENEEFLSQFQDTFVAGLELCEPDGPEP